MKVKDNGSNYKFYDGSPSANPMRSSFDLSYINTLTAKLGVRIPVWTQHTLMNEDYNVGIEAVLRVVNPPVVPLLSRQRVLFHTWYLSYPSLWKFAQLFFDKGKNKRQFNVASTYTIPKIKLKGSWVRRGSLADNLGFNYANKDNPTDSESFSFSALKFMAYIRIWRDCYMNQRIYSAWLGNLANSNDANASSYLKLYNFLFPADDDDFRIGSSQWNDVVNDDFCLEFLFKDCVYADFADDYFTRGQLSPMYVDEDKIPVVDLGSANTDFSFVLKDTAYGKQYPNGYNGVGNGLSSGEYGTIQRFNVTSPSNLAAVSPQLLEDKSYTTDGRPVQTNLLPNAQVDLLKAMNNTFGISGGSVVSRLTIESIRRCESATLILEKMAKTDGSYAQYAKAFFGERPKSAYDYRPVYVGGAYQSITYSQVLNTTSDNQGKITGIGVSSGSGNIGRFHSDDYGLFMTIMTIVPDTYYCQGLQREDTYEVAEDFFLPERAQLGMQGILQKEIFNQNDSHEDDNNKLFGYQNIYDELRYRANEVHGEVANVNSASGTSGASMSPYIQTRFFLSAPTLTPSFLSMKDNINNNWLSSKNEPPFIVQIANKVNAIRPVPYRAQPATFGM